MSSLLAVGVGQFLVTKTKDQIKPPHTHGLPWLHPPDLPGVLRDGPVRAELAATGDVVDGAVWHELIQTAQLLERSCGGGGGGGGVLSSLRT